MLPRLLHHFEQNIVTNNTCGCANKENIDPVTGVDSVAAQAIRVLKNSALYAKRIPFSDITHPIPTVC